MKAFNTVIPHTYKIVGYVMAATGLLAAILYGATDIKIIPAMDSEPYVNLSFIFLAMGLYWSGMSREKHEDERVKAIRSRAIAITFVLLVNSILAFSISQLMFTDHTISIRSLLFMLLIPLAFYHVAFNIGLYRDSNWEYNEEERQPTPDKQKVYLYLIVSAFVIGFIIITILLKQG